ncbi:dTDP-4-dehydrorhamnose 3,5-epimerase [Algoriphagus ratkowskyi]|uniref:dTDP-4-dehydrorhamnose 3,5-epimerase n=1 Tax=Algoriphagus ratkowskyi TaxID=57028 RepID=A0A2W7QZ18_9BACT|nr:dTDP-4-dehydrorhamnose 3,5-epimerase family protein [Algoriphagus ratkowskyi]PZX51290.1 dTDP-4-dehydrorhamnose 3,5-epimerase [Algoriphagus ratkowskyi]TXD75920.1 dTDP-4-keto-6-deoxy-D-glucose epimerase [Algoriphagus ratkowskyi]
MKVKPTKIEGCFEIEIIIREDGRGRLVKNFHKTSFEKLGLMTDFPEHYYSVSKKNVLRGLHFQVPSQHHIKLVSCLEGRILDVVVDLRIGSPTYGDHLMIELNSEKANMLYVPEGCAHGFFTLSTKSIFLNRTSTMYSNSHDGGIHWDSCGIEWPTTNPIISKKDKYLPELENFDSPFKFQPTI